MELHAMKILFTSFFLTFLFVSVSVAQTVSVKKFSLTTNRGQPTSYVISGDNLSVTGSFYDSTFPFIVCNPCKPNDSLRFTNNFLFINARNARGVINGVEYPQIYLGGGFSWTQEENPLIFNPKTWSKRTKVFAQLDLTGSFGAWTNSMDVGHIDKAVFYQSGIQLKGNALLFLGYRGILPSNPPRRLYQDGFLYYTFSSGE